MKAVLCPVCNGSGKREEKQCHGCLGKGWVEVSDSTYYYPYPYYDPPYYPQPYWQPYEPYRYEVTCDDLSTPLTSISSGGTGITLMQ